MLSPLMMMKPATTTIIATKIAVMIRSEFTRLNSSGFSSLHETTWYGSKSMSLHE